MIKSLEKHWWDFEPVHPQKYRESPKKITKADKIAARMAQIQSVKESMRPQRKAERNVSILKGAIK